MRLLIVDDNAHFLKAARALLESEGLTIVATATTRAEALWRAEEYKPDVTLVDVDLGTDSGFDLARQLAASTRGVRSSVILISANPEQDLVELIEDSPAIGFVSKSKLSRQAIVELLDRRQNTTDPPSG